jgi:hypothetical protein
MRLVPISEILNDLEVDETVLAVRGTVKRVWDRNEGTGDNGDWSVQNVVISDGKKELKVAVWNHDPIPVKWKGKEVLIECSKSEKHGWVGVKTEDNEHKGKITRQLKVTKAGEINLASERDEGGGDDEPAPDKKKSAPTDDETPAPAGNWQDVKVHISGPLHDKLLGKLEPGQRTWLIKTWVPRVLSTDLSDQDTALVLAVKAMAKAAAEKPAEKLPTDKVDENRGRTNGGGGEKPRIEPGSDEAVTNVKLELMRRANLYKMCVGAVTGLIEPNWKEYTGAEMSMEQQQATIASMFIGAEKAGLHHMLPSVQIDKKKKPADADKN